MHQSAFVTFVMLNDHYVPGALVFAHALRKQRVDADILCLITPEVSLRAKTALRVLFDDVIMVDPIVVHHPDHHGRQDRPFLFTRFQAFRLGMDGNLHRHYDKLVIADADLLPISDYQSLFDLPSPAGIINESKEHCVSSSQGKYLQLANQNNPNEWLWHYIYRATPHGFPIPKAITDRILEDPNNLGINACLYRIDPKMDDYKSIQEDLKNPEILKRITTYPWPEMQYLTLKFSGSWHNIDLRYASFNGYPRLDILKGTHYAGLKPWQIKSPSVPHFAKYEDYQLFFRTYIDMIRQYPALINYPKLERIHACFQKYLLEK